MLHDLSLALSLSFDIQAQVAPSYAIAEVLDEAAGHDPAPEGVDDDVKHVAQKQAPGLPLRNLPVLKGDEEPDDTVRACHRWLDQYTRKYRRHSLT